MLALKQAQPRILCVIANDLSVELWESILDALDAVTPLIDDVRPGLLYLDMHGMPGDPRRWIEQARTRLAACGVTACIGAGGNKFIAYAATCKGDGTICAIGAERTFLAPLSLDLLEIDERVRERLKLLGLEKLGDLARLPHGPFVRRFGSEAAAWHARARGEDVTPFRPRAHKIAIEASVFGEGRVEEEAQLFFALRLILSRICIDLDRCGKRAGAIELVLELEDGADRQIDVPVALPSADERVLNDIVRAKLSGIRFPCAIVGLSLRAIQLEEGGEALPIFPADDVDPRHVTVTLARLESAIGEPPRRATTRPAHALERRFSYEPYVIPSPSAALPSQRAQDRFDGEGSVSQHALISQLRLLIVREISVRLRRGVPSLVEGLRVLECHGPWRVEEGWFADTAVSRDEYDVLLSDRSLVRIYRQGKRWYLRGAYD
jgi:nucleotidyltransferase/DNA polymerase involved in DNA repair